MRLGDLDALKEKLSGANYQTYTHEYGYAIPTDSVMNAIDNTPTVDFEKLGESLNCQIRAKYGSCDDCLLSCPRNELIKLLGLARPQGEWARHDEWIGGEYVGGFYHVNCPCIDLETAFYSKWRTNFCPNCGAYMKGGAE